jgi:hypothetical protein
VKGYGTWIINPGSRTAVVKDPRGGELWMAFADPRPSSQSSRRVAQTCNPARQAYNFSFRANISTNVRMRFALVSGFLAV